MSVTILSDNNRRLQILQGTEAENDAFTGYAGELSMDTTNNQLRLHDGSTQGGHKIGVNGYHPDLFTFQWADHELNDVQWLRADTFSWQDGGVYEAAYNHLVADLGNNNILYAWTSTGSSTYYTKSSTPSVGDAVYNANGTTVQYTVATVGDGYITLSELSVAYYRNASNDTFADSETISGITIKYMTATDGHKICLANEESNVAAIYAATGVAWYYIIDTTNTRFKLPRTKFGFTGLRDTVGNYIAPGLPNIAGPSAHAWTENSNYGGSAPFYKAAASGTGVGSSGTSSTYRQFFDASLSNSIYGNSTTVQPPATQMYLYFYVGNFTQTALENTAGITAETLNDKADLDFGNTTMIDYVVAKQDPSSSNNYTWYRKYASGWVEQGGTFTNAGVQVTLPIPMANTNYTLVAGYPDSSSTNYPQWTFMGIARTTTSITPQASGLAQSWMVCGKAA